MQHSSPILSRVEAAAYLGLAKQTLARWACENRGPARVMVSRRRCGYLRADLDAFLAERRIETPNADSPRVEG